MKEGGKGRAGRARMSLAHLFVLHPNKKRKKSKRKNYVRERAMHENGNLSPVGTLVLIRYGKFKW